MDEIFPEAQRQVFPYHNGSKKLFGDPLAIESRFLAALAAAGTDGETVDNSLASKVVAERLHAGSQIAAAVRESFRLVPFDEETGEGVTDEGVKAIWNRFNAWRDSLKADTGPGQNTPPPTDDSPASPDPSVAPEPTLTPTPQPEPTPPVVASNAVESVT